MDSLDTYISLCTVYGWNYPSSLGIQLINTLIVTFLDKFVLPGRNKHGINPQGVENKQTVADLTKMVEGDARVQSALDLLLARVD